MTDGLLSRGSANGRQRVADVSDKGGVQAMRLLIAFDPLQSAGPSENGHKGDTAEADALGSPLEANWPVAPSGGFWAVREVCERPLR